jgi:hypothetical protein
LTFNGLHSVTYQKIELFVTNAVRTSNPAGEILVEGKKDEMVSFNA